jgi:thiamine-phosphate pyrophosphorylase
MLVTDRHLSGGEDELVRAVDAAIDGGVNVVQLRGKDLSADALSALSGRLREVTQDRVLLIVNGSADAAIESGADGVHLSEEAPMPEERAGLIVGRSVHSVEAARRAEGEDVDYVVAGPIYETRSHPGAVPAGADLIRKISEVVSVPVIAIGGIDYQRVTNVMRAGASGVAVISAILGSSNPREAAAQLRSTLEEGAPS